MLHWCAIEIHINFYNKINVEDILKLMCSASCYYEILVFITRKFQALHIIWCIGLLVDVFLAVRIHAEFQLNSEPSYPFWFSPAQFAGRLIVNKTSKHVEHFELTVAMLLEWWWDLRSIQNFYEYKIEW